MKVRRIDFYPADWLAGTIGLSNCERGLYITACMLIYSHGGPIRRDDLRAACGVDHGNAFNRQIGRLLVLGKLTEEDGLVDNKRCEKELENVGKRLAKASENGVKGNEIKRLRDATRPLSPSPSPSPKEGVETLGKLEEGSTPSTAQLPREGDGPDLKLVGGKDVAHGRDGKPYAFARGVIKLNTRDLAEWRKAYHRIPDLEAELQAADDWCMSKLPPEKRKDWFYIVSKMLKDRHQEYAARERAEQEEEDRLYRGLL